MRSDYFTYSSLLVHARRTVTTNPFTVIKSTPAVIEYF